MMKVLFEEMATGCLLEYRAISFTLTNLTYNVVLSDSSIIHLNGCRFVSCTPDKMKDIEVIPI